MRGPGQVIAARLVHGASLHSNGRGSRSAAAAGWARICRPLLLILPLSGCESEGAPSLILFGAYFPAWLLCAVVGVLGAVLMRLVMVRFGLSSVLPQQLAICASVGLIVAVALWRLWFGR